MVRPLSARVRWRHGRPVGLVAPAKHRRCRYKRAPDRSLEHKLLETDWVH